MENKKIIVENCDVVAFIEFNEIFLWSLESKNDLNNGKSELIFTRDDSKEYIENLRYVENEFQIKFIPLVVAIIPTILAFLTMTAFLITFFLLKDKVETYILLLSFIIPTAIFLFLSMILNFVRTKRLEKWNFKRAELFKEAKEQVSKIVK